MQEISKTMENYKMVAKTFAGLEPVLAQELKKLGAIDVQQGIRSVSFYGDLGFMYKANLSLRTALRILKPIEEFKSFSDEDFYRKIYAMDWLTYFDENSSFAIDSTVHSKTFTHSQYMTLKAKDAIVDKFRNENGSRPNIDVDNPDVRINIRIAENICTISLDSSGDSLHKRGYRKRTVAAPINEVLAAGMVMLTGWKGFPDFLDPMCGSGTILIEAAMIAANIPPNLNNNGFGFQKWKNWNEELFQVILNAQLKKVKEFSGEIRGYDKDAEAIEITKENIENADLSSFIKVERKDFFASSKYTEKHLVMVFNPPYGERLRIDIPRFYNRIGNTLKNYYADSEAWLITSEEEAMKNVGLRTSKRIKLYNGPLEARLLKYDIYKGTKKRKRKRIKRTKD